LFLKVLGSAAGGGYPQWNCACPNCARARSGSSRARTNDSLAVSADGRSWALLNASPDVCSQLEAHAAFRPGPSVRGSPVRAVLLTDAELDHAAGLLQLRQSAPLDVYAPPPVVRALSEDFPVRRIVEPFASFRWLEALPGESFPLFGGQLTVCPFLLGGKPPRYVHGDSAGEEKAWVVGYRLEDAATGGVAVYAPGVENWSPELERRLAEADCVFLDGTFWRSDELVALGVSGKVAADMGHLPVGGPGGTAERLARLPAKRKVYIHVNNTNPMLDDVSPENRSLRELGIEIGYDGMEMEV